MKHRIILKNKAIDIWIRMCKECQKMGVTMFKKGGICITCVRRQRFEFRKYHRHLIPWCIRGKTSREVLEGIRDKTIKEIPILKKMTTGYWTKCEAKDLKKEERSRKKK